MSALSLGAALAADAFAVSVACGSSDSDCSWRRGVISSSLFGVFQGIMPMLGWGMGRAGSGMTGGFEGIISCAVLCIIGLKMLWDGRHSPDNEISDTLGIRGLIFLAFATSVDALSAGITLPSSAGVKRLSELMICAALIAAITFVLSLAGYAAGRKTAGAAPAAARFIGGAVLIIVGLRSMIF